MTPKELREDLEVLLAAQLGTYTASDGVTTSPAIAVLYPNEEVDTSAVDGLEVIILRYAASSRNRLLYTENTVDRKLQVYLVQHRSSTTHNLDAAISIIQARYPDAVGTIVSTKEQTGVLAQYAITIEDMEISPADRTYSFTA